MRIRRDKEDRDVLRLRVGADFVECPETVQPWHRDVEDYGIRLFRPGEAECFVAIHRNDDMVASAMQLQLQKMPDVRIVLRDE